MGVKAALKEDFCNFREAKRRSREAKRRRGVCGISVKQLK
jgi:hypothetical protein